MVGRSHSGSRSWLPVAARRWFSAKPAMTIFMQGDLLKGSIYHIHGRRRNSSLDGKPDALKGACPVWREAHGTGPLTKWYLAGCLPYVLPINASIKKFPSHIPQLRKWLYKAM